MSYLKLKMLDDHTSSQIYEAWGLRFATIQLTSLCIYAIWEGDFHSRPFGFKF